MHIFGLTYILALTYEQKHIPMDDADIDVQVTDQIANITLSQRYTNRATSPVDASYVFPVPAKAAVYAFNFVRGDGTRVLGIVKEKEEAKAEFQAAVKAGRTAALGEEQTKDVFKISIGNINVNETIVVNLSYAVELLDDETTDQVKFVLPAKFGSRYGSSPSDVLAKGSSGYLCTINVGIQQPGAIKSISCPSSHPIEFELGRSAKDADSAIPDTHFASVRLLSRTFLDKDFILSIKAANLDAPRCVIEPHPSPNHQTVAMALTLVPRFTLPDVKGGAEYIFLVDRSGSMNGERMTSAKRALVVLIRGLPSKDTTFNVISFGSTTSALWDQGSRAYTTESLEEATKHVDSMSANFRGTEIERALHYTFDRRSKGSRPTNVFVLTDGDCKNVTPVLNIVRDAVAAHPIRVFCLGIGSGISTEMCEGIGRAGHGFALFVSDGEEMTGKCAKMVKAARTPLVGDIEVEWCPHATSESKNDDDDDDFELIDDDKVGRDEEKLSEPAKPKKVSLFDNTADEDTDLTTGPPPPMVISPDQLPEEPIQQGPYKIQALYPGVRFLVYAILSTKVLSKTSTMPTSIKLRGKVLNTGDIVELDVPVQLSMLGAKDAAPVHTLAARKLVTCLEDSNHNFSPEISANSESLKAHLKAKIIQLGTTYQITTGHTSFVAVDHVTQPVERVAHLQPVLLAHKCRDFAVGGGSRPDPSHEGYTYTVKGVQPPGFDAQSFGSPLVSAGKPLFHRANLGTEPRGSSIAPAPSVLTHADESWSPPESWSMSRDSGAPGRSSEGSRTKAKAASHSSAPPRPRPAAASAPPPPPARHAPGNARPELESVASFDRRSRPNDSEDSLARSTAPQYATYNFKVANTAAKKARSRSELIADVAAPGLEDPLDALARSQNFDGSFSLSEPFLKLVNVSDPRGSLSKLGLSQQELENDMIVATLLGIRFMRSALAGLKDSWEALYEKAMEFLGDVMGEQKAKDLVQNLVE